MTEVSLYDILLAREKRVRLQDDMINRFQSPIISFTMNIAGPQKNSALIRRAFRVGLDYLDSAIAESSVKFKHIDLLNPAGPLAIYSLDLDIMDIKNICVEAEEKTALGRLFDMDVIDTSHNKISRSSERGCIVCGAPGRACAAGRIHPINEIVSTMNQIMMEGLLEYDAERFAILVKDCLVREVRTTPKPGLVDLNNNGSHKDMSVDTFERSAYALLDYFKACFIIGSRHSNDNELFLELRNAGLAAEKSMYQATDGVNTHKGAIFSFGILCGALGQLWTSEKSVPELETLLWRVGLIAQNAIIYDFYSPIGCTAGERMYISHGLTGIRGEAASGFKSVQDVALPLYSSLLKDGLSQNEAGVITLLHLIAYIDDTAIYNRGGIDGLNFAKACASELLQKEKVPQTSEIEALDAEFIQRNLSAGGSADLLAVTYFLYEINKIRDEQN